MSLGLWKAARRRLRIGDAIDRPDRIETAPASLSRDGEGSASAGPEIQWYPGYASDDLRLFDDFTVEGQTAEPGFIRDFLGVRTRVGSMWTGVQHLSGQVLGIPVPADHHAEAVEWIGLLKSVASAGDRYVAMELGAGWGLWLVAGAAAARRRGIADIRLLAVEGDPDHFTFLEQHFRDNGLVPEQHRLYRAAVGPAAGRARWPKVGDPREDWGSRPLLPATNGEGGVQKDHLGRTFEAFIDVEFLPFGKLLRQEELWDLVHIDVQGTEVELCRSALDLLAARVRRLVIGTHSRKIDGELIELLHGEGWLLEHEKPTRMILLPPPTPLIGMTIVDGTQVWRNATLG